MSSKELKPKYIKCESRSKKFKPRILTDIEGIGKEYNCYSCEKKINQSKNSKNFQIENNVIQIKNIDDLEALPLINIDYIYSAWKASKLVWENIEKKISNKKDFKVNFETLDITSQNGKAEIEFADEQFWILYIDYLIKNNKVKTAENFLKIINKAFSNCDDYNNLIYYYFDKIKIFNPIIKNGKIEEKDEAYIDLLDTAVKSRIKEIKENLASKVKISSKQKFYEYTPIKKIKKE